MIKDTDTSDNFSDTNQSLLEVALEGIGWITNNLGALGDLLSLSDSCNLSIFENDFIDISVQHEGTSIDGTHSGESFWDTSQSVDWVDEWGITVSSMRIHIELDFFDSEMSWLLQEIIISVKGNSVSQEISGVWLKLELLNNLGEWLSSNINLFLFPGLWISEIDLLNILEEILASLLFKKSHQITLDSLSVISWDFFDLGTTR